MKTSKMNDVSNFQLTVSNLTLIVGRTTLQEESTLIFLPPAVLQQCPPSSIFHGGAVMASGLVTG
jgi:hypothetical protein